MRKRGREINVFSVSALDLFASALGAFILMSLIFMVFFSMTTREEGIAEEVFAQCENERAQIGRILAGVESSLAQCQADFAASVDADTFARCEAERGAAGDELAQCRNSLANAVDAATLARCEADLATAAANAADLEISLGQSGALRAQLDDVSAELQSCREMARLGFVLVIASWSTNDDVDLHVVDPAGREYYFAERRYSGSAAAFEEDNISGPGNEVWLHPAAEPGSYRVCYKLYTRRGLSRPEVRGNVLWQEGGMEIPRVDLAREDEVRLAVNIVVDADGNVALDRSRSGLVLGQALCG